MIENLDQFARELPRLTLHGPIPTGTVMALAARVVELLSRVEEIEEDKSYEDAGLLERFTKMRKAVESAEARVAELVKLEAEAEQRHVEASEAFRKMAARVEVLESAILRAIELNERVPQDKLSTQVVAQRNQLRAVLGLIVPDQSGDGEPKRFKAKGPWMPDQGGEAGS